MSLPSSAETAEPPKRLLLLNVDDTMPDLVSQIDEVLPRGSHITILSPTAKASSFRLRHTATKHLRGNPSSIGDLKALDPSQFDAIVCLQPGSGSDADDSRLLVSLLGLEQAVRNDEQESEDPGVPRVISEVYSPGVLDLIQARMPGLAVRSDLILPSELASGILVQCALQPHLREVYTILLNAEGSEICMKAAEHYVPSGEIEVSDAATKTSGCAVTFGQLAAGARARGEIAIGVFRAGDTKPTINPPKSTKLHLQTGDRLVVIGEAF